MNVGRKYFLLALSLSMIFVLYGGHTAWGEAGQSGDGSAAAGPMSDPSQASELTPRDLYKYCDRTLDRLRSDAHGLVREAQVTYIDLNEIRATQKQIREQFGKLQDHQKQFYGQFSAEQLHGVYKRTYQLDVWRGRIDGYLNTIDEIIAAPEVDHPRLIEQSRLAERAFRAYQLHFHEMGDELGIERR